MSSIHLFFIFIPIYEYKKQRQYILMKQPYIRLLKITKNIKIYRVDGNYIRNKIDVNFNNAGHYKQYDYIPIHEIWIDKDFSKRGDESLLSNQLLTELALIKKGRTLWQALNKSANDAQKERQNNNGIPKNKTYDHIYVKKLKQYSKNDISVWLINGKLVRDNLYIHFTEGGHHYVYKFIPKNEVWIDDSLNPKEYDYVLYHELIERNLMKMNKYSYAQAHDVAIKIEDALRKTRTDPNMYILAELNRTQSAVKN
jgi:hypothetical protein